MAWMYILECSDGTYYVGSTKDLEYRISEHQGGKGAKYTSQCLPVKLVIQKNMKELLMPIQEKSKFKIGVEQNERH